MAIRNNIVFTFNDNDIGLYEKPKSRKIKPCEEVEFASDNSKIIARNILNWLIKNDLCNIIPVCNMSLPTMVNVHRQSAFI